MNPPAPPPRVLTLPPRGKLLVSADLHGNFADFERLREIFLGLRAEGEAAWVLLGDLVHGPSPRAALEFPRLYGFPDESAALVAALDELQAECPGRVHYVLGNHDHGHVGGRHTSKFHPDEVEALEAALEPGEVARLRALFERALLAVVAPCGALLSHGSPDDRLHKLADLDAVSFRPEENDEYQNALLESLLHAYGQPPEVTDALLATVSAAGVAVRFVVHGHDRDEAGWFVEGGNQACPVIFGAPPEAKRILVLELEARYASVDALRDGAEIRRLYPETR